MSSAVIADEAQILDPAPALVRRMFRNAAQALMANRPMREVSASAPTPPLSKGEIDALRRVGANLQPWTAGAANDPLTRTIVDYMALIETSLSTAAAAAMLKVDVSRIRQRIRERSLLGLEYEGSWRLPRFQFERGKVLPGLAAILSPLPEGINPLDVATWFLEPDVDLEMGDETPSPRQWLLGGGDPATLARLACDLFVR